MTDHDRAPHLQHRGIGRAVVLLTGLLLLGVCGTPSAAAAETQSLGIAMEQFDYPHPVRYQSMTIENKDVRMAYMDVKPSEGSDKPPVVLMHGKNFFGAYWEDTIRALNRAGRRVIVPDQIGFGKSSKPDIYYSFHRLARSTARLLDRLEVGEVVVVGHSMGGMLATRFSLMYPQRVDRLVLENPIGLEDYRSKVPFRSVEQIYRNVLSLTEDSIRRYQRTYYVNWKPEYETYVQVHYRWTLSGEYPRLAWASALTAQMIYTQPVVHQLSELNPPTLLVIGLEDRTTLGRGRVSNELLKTLGRYPKLGRRASGTIPNSQLVELEGVGHIPHLAADRAFHRALLEFLP